MNELPPPDLPAAPDPVLAAFRRVPRTGVIFVTEEAKARGYSAGDPDWCNLGQGQPETGQLPGAPPRIDRVELTPGSHEYAPVTGLPELREAVAEMYNALFRRGMPSRYTAENVAISSGGRVALTRAAAALGPINLGHFLPDYTAYEELLDLFRPFIPIPILLDREDGYRFGVENLEREIMGRGLAAVLLSNPTNPTGKLVGGEELSEWVDCARRLDCTLLLDEFYSHYVWRDDCAPISSAARFVEDVDRDPVVIFDGLTKNWRYPGWRVGWTVGPRTVIEALASAGSFLDGGAPNPLQRAAVPLLDPDRVLADVGALRAAFLPKRAFMLRRLRELGFEVDVEPEGTFYVFASLRSLPEPLRDGLVFFGACLPSKVVCVPGVFFDVNPGQRRAHRHSRSRDMIRFSYGPPIEELERGLDRIERLLATLRG